MAGSGNAIGTGALILTANADQMVAGLDAAQGKATKFASSTGKMIDKATSGSGASKGGGLFNSILGGAAGGAVAGLVIGGIEKISDFASSAAHELLNALSTAGALAEKLRPFAQSNADASALDSIGFAVQRVDSAVGQLQIKFLTALAPAITAVSDIILAALDRWAPEIDQASKAFGAIAYAAVEVGGAVVGELMKAIDSTNTWGTTTKSASGTIFDSIHTVADSFAMLWDNIVQGTAVALKAFSNIVFGLNVLITAIGDVRKAMIATFGSETMFKIAATAGGAGLGFLRGGYVGAGVGGLAGYGLSSALTNFDTDKLSNDLTGLQVGLDGLAGKLGKVGSIVPVVDKAFDGMPDRFAAMQAAVQNMGSRIPVKLPGAFDQNSKDAYSINAQYNASGRDLSNMQKNQIDAINRGNKLLGDCRDLLKTIVDSKPETIWIGH